MVLGLRLMTARNSLQTPRPGEPTGSATPVLKGYLQKYANSSWHRLTGRGREDRGIPRLRSFLLRVLAENLL